MGDDCAAHNRSCESDVVTDPNPGPNVMSESTTMQMPESDTGSPLEHQESSELPLFRVSECKRQNRVGEMRIQMVNCERQLTLVCNT
jgi:hypothetical protein